MIETPQPVRLTQFSHGAGCGCKIAPSVLEEILKGSGSKLNFPGLLVGNESKDDAAVLELADGNCLISTTDFFMPIVDDAFDFGRIAAANSISDVFAMGGKPILAIAILGWPVNKIPAELAREVIAGARSICDEANIPLAGGHSIDSPEPIFGLAVSGMVKKDHLKKNNTAKPGDLLFLTKPLGTGILSTASKRGKISEEDLKTVIGVMTTLNKAGEKIGGLKGVHALTDVTGFGLLGHLVEMAEGSGLSAVVNYKDVPLINGLERYIQQMIIPDSLYRNWNSYQHKITGVKGPSFIPLCDPQTSGGLLASVDPSSVNEFLDAVRSCGVTISDVPVGRITEKKDFVVEVVE
ncbi:MAG: selenide, water dikinase SelD [Bacteroidetes bacterium]|nr:selenide, water dikinase SelD [Bacteroidota bacterium]